MMTGDSTQVLTGIVQLIHDSSEIRKICVSIDTSQGHVFQILKDIEVEFHCRKTAEFWRSLFDVDHMNPDCWLVRLDDVSFNSVAIALYDKSECAADIYNDTGSS